jgi:TonB family protein
MPQQPTPPSDVYTSQEIARAAGVRPGEAARLVRSGRLATLDGRFVGAREAARAVRLLRGDVRPARQIFEPTGTSRRPTGTPLLASGALHGAAFGLALLLSACGARGPIESTSAPVKPLRLVYLTLPGPGGGGGGGGLQQEAPPPKARLRGPSKVASPVVARLTPPQRPRPIERRRPVPPRPAVAARRPVETPAPLLEHRDFATLAAPVATIAAGRVDRLGLVETAGETGTSQGPGTGGGVGTGQGTGIGEGTGPGLGPGSGGGTGGGPYQPGSGIDPPRLLREVKPQYTEAALRQRLEGEVVVEVVVLHDGRVGDVRLVQRLGAGLDERAIDAVRQWLFEPARRLGTPVDVVVEIAVDFSLR